MRSHLIAQGEPIGNIEGFGNFAPDLGGANSATQIENLVSTAVGFLTVVAGLAFLIYFIIGALNWVTAGGDSKKVDDAKHYMTNGAIGMIVIVAAYAITWIVGTVLGIDILNPANLDMFKQK